MPLIFVFGSNLMGYHGKGAALFAVKHFGAKRFRYKGRIGNSYAIPTKDARLRSLPLTSIKFYVDNFIKYANNHPELKFFITAIGCGLARYKPEQIAPFFRRVPDNCILPYRFQKVLGFKNDNSLSFSERRCSNDSNLERESPSSR